MSFRILLIFAAFGGFLLAFYIRHKKHAREKMVCPLDSDCDAVVYSKYATFLGIPVEILGLFYYGFIAVSYAIFLGIPSFASTLTVFGTLVITAAAFLFSLYLTFIQAFALKQWCSWCLTSAGLCTVIFGTALISSEFSFLGLLAQYRGFILAVHILGVALGLGGATITDIFFFKFLKDFRISDWEAEVMHTLSQVIWFSLAILVLGGIGLYLPEAHEFNQSPKFLLKMVVVSVLVVNGAFLNLFIAPKLIHISFGQKHDHEAGELRRIRKFAFALGAISIASWYSAFLLGFLPRGVFPEFWTPLFGYLLIVGAGVATSQLLERLFSKKAP
ncbi:MAG: vitamin K epoxide reductase family protein [Candidatus Sungbacteria bacterium]|nr:vitamin K epoxide reductase family protein [Candidatus Sungbacteria bacterium]